MKIYNKLVRDKIPEIIENDNLIPITKILNFEEYKKELNKKLLEEVNEYLIDDNIEELADVLEVIYNILYTKNINIEALENLRKQKEIKRGSFKKKIYLERVEEKSKNECNG